MVKSEKRTSIKQHYYALYTSSNEGVTTSFVTAPQDTMVFPPMVKYESPLLKDPKGKTQPRTYRFVKTFMVASTSQLRKFEEYCDEHHLETEVVLTKANLRP
jgi:hypothetical protein